MATVTIPKVLANFETALSSKISSSASSLTADRSTDMDGTTLSGTYSLTLDEGTSLEEHMVVTMAGASGTIVRRGLSRADGWTEVAGNKKEHDRGASIKVTNVSLLNLQRLLSGSDSFNSVAWTGVASVDGLATPTSGEATKAANVDYVNNVALAGAPDASTGAKGVVEVATAAEAAAGTDVGGTTGPLVTIPSQLLAAQEKQVTDGYPYGETIAAGDVLYLDVSDGKWKLASGASSATCAGRTGIALDAGVLDDAGKRVQFDGIVTGLAGLTPGYVYVSDTAGDLSSSAGTFRKCVGRALTATTLQLIDTFQISRITGANAATTTANLNEAMTFFDNTDITGAEAEDLTDGGYSTAHKHDAYQSVKNDLLAGTRTFIGGFGDGMTSFTAGTGAVQRTQLTTNLFSTAIGDDAGLTTAEEFSHEADPADRGFEWDDISTSSKVHMIATVQFSGAVTQDFFFGLYTSAMTAAPANATDVSRHVGFMLDDGTLYYSVADGTTQNRVDAGAFTATSKNVLEITYDKVTARFYLNGVELGSGLTANIPTGTATSPFFNIIYTGQSANDQSCVVGHPFALKLTTS